MLTSVVDDLGNDLDAKVEVEEGKVILHSRGGAFGKPNLRNPDYRKALVAILSRLQASNLDPARVLVDSREARKVSVEKRVLAEAYELIGPVEELVAKIVKKAAAFGREPGASGHGNQTKRVLIELPGASKSQIFALLQQSTSLPPIIYFNIGWMKHYAGPRADDPTVGGHRWLASHSHGLECFNFLPTNTGEVEGYRPLGARDKVDIGRLGAKSGDDSVDGILVVWLAREPGSGKTFIVGWYRDATVYRHARRGQYRLQAIETEFSVMAPKGNAILVPATARDFHVLSSRTAPGEGFGQKPTWYGAPAVDMRVWSYVNSWENAKRLDKPAKRTRAPRNCDPELRRKVEKAAVGHAWDYYEAKYGMGCVESVEPYGRGWDLEVRSGEIEWLVEVKGLLNTSLTCELTPNEYEKMNTPEYRSKYVIYVVNNALAEEPEVPVPSVFTWKDSGTWSTDDGRDLQILPKVGAILTCC